MADDFGSGPLDGPGKLSYEAESLAAFKARVDRLLTELEQSSADHRRVGDQTVAQASFGTGFEAARTLAGHYETVHRRLHTFCRLLGEQIEALGIAAQISQRGYDGVEEEQLRRFQAIGQRSRQHQHYTAWGGDGQGENRPATDRDRAATESYDSSGQDSSYR